MRAKLPRVSRRQLLVGGGAGVGLLVAFHLWPRETLAPYGSEDSAGRFSHYLKIGSDGTIAAVVPQVEYGQGAWTAFALLIARELGVPPSSVAVEPAPPGPGLENMALAETYGRSLRATAGATSIRAFERPVREAAAIARELLAREAASRLDADIADIRVEGTDMVAGGKHVAIAEIAEAASERSVPNSAKLTKWNSDQEPAARVDIPAKARGSWRIAADVRLPGMLFASARLAPPNGRILSIDRAAASTRAAVETLVERESWVAAVAGTWWEAERAIAAAKVRYGSPSLDGELIRERMEVYARDRAARTIAETGNARRALEAAQGPIRQTYFTYPLPHRDLEPLSATARARNDGGVEVWAGTLAPDATRQSIAKATRLSLDEVTLYPMPCGGDGGRGLEQLAAPLAATIARNIDKPVQLSLSPAHSAAQDRLGTPILARMAATPGADGRIGGWHARFGALGGLGSALARLDGDRGAPPDVEGAIPPYGIPDLLVEQVDASLKLSTGYVSGHVAGFHTFANEQMVDEVARALGAEPLSFRLAMASPRVAPLIARVGRLANWDGGGGSMGLACAEIDGSAIALVVDAVRSGGEIAINSLNAVIDCGRAVDRTLVMRAVEAGMMSAAARMTAPLSAIENAMAAAPTYSPALHSLPTVRIELANSGGTPGGVSALGHAVLPAALANALAAGRKARLRTLPFTAHENA